MTSDWPEAFPWPTAEWLHNSLFDCLTSSKRFFCFSFIQLCLKALFMVFLLFGLSCLSLCCEIRGGDRSHYFRAKDPLTQRWRGYFSFLTSNESISQLRSISVFTVDRLFWTSLFCFFSRGSDETVFGIKLRVTSPIFLVAVYMETLLKMINAVFSSFCDVNCTP